MTEQQLIDLIDELKERAQSYLKGGDYWMGRFVEINCIIDQLKQLLKEK